VVGINKKRIEVLAGLGKNRRPYLKNNTKRIGSVTQVVETSKRETLSLVPVLPKEEKF
jgi:hypothetical protein